jgi:hypothetical protein
MVELDGTLAQADTRPRKPPSIVKPDEPTFADGVALQLKETEE